MRFSLLILTALLLLCAKQTQSQIVVEDDKYEVFAKDGKLYKPYTNWLTLGIGKSYIFEKRDSLFLDDTLYHTYNGFDNSFHLGFHFRVKDFWLNLGYHHSSKEFFLYRPPIRMDEFYIGAGYCLETEKYHISGFVSPSYTIGNYYNPIPKLDSLGKIDNYYLFTSFRKPGVNLKVSYVRKIYYDVGIGLTAYASINRRYPSVGLQLNIFFSGAYKGNLN
ncbi:MAG: hypothetical protein JXR58_08205 [Bacteroidales bacterium]|nr:hypothetical protein [Bacteroidales bacterium]